MGELENARVGHSPMSSVRVTAETQAVREAFFFASRLKQETKSLVPHLKACPTDKRGPIILSLLDSLGDCIETLAPLNSALQEELPEQPETWFDRQRDIGTIQLK